MIGAAIFDMDGLLVESESLWRVAEQEASDQLGLGFGDDDFERTKGMRMPEVTKLWATWSPWDGPSTDEVAASVVDRMVELLADVQPMPGVLHALDLFESRSIRVGLCSSSDLRLIEAVLAATGLTDRFEVVHSAQSDPMGKPHPDPYLTTARRLDIDPTNCVAIEDSLAGCVSARSAQMKVIAVPEPADSGSARFGFCDLVLDSLNQLDDESLDRIDGTAPIPTLSRPRFHLAFPVADLDQARHFYGEVLGCREGRSSDRWIDFDLWGHQIVTQLSPSHAPLDGATNQVDGHDVPVSHFGLVLHPSAWRALVDRLTAHDVEFLMQPTTRFAGDPGEQHTCFVRDPSGNALEFKAFADDRSVFAN